jgi:hypothetical protein
VSELRLLIRNHKPTIVGITEVKLKNFRYDIEDAEIALDGYDMFGCNLHNKTGRVSHLLFFHHFLYVPVAGGGLLL